jgi:hypothetical protein
LSFPKGICVCSLYSFIVACFALHIHGQGHLDRSGSQSLREARSGETPHFGSAVACSLPLKTTLPWVKTRQTETTTPQNKSEKAGVFLSPKISAAKPPHSPCIPPRFHHQKPHQNRHFFQNPLEKLSKTSKLHPEVTPQKKSAKEHNKSNKIDD